METYKKPVVASKNGMYDVIPTLPAIVAVAPALVFASKLLGDDDFHKEESLTPRKKSVE